MNKLLSLALLMSITASTTLPVSWRQKFQKLLPKSWDVTRKLDGLQKLDFRHNCVSELLAISETLEKGSIEKSSFDDIRMKAIECGYDKAFSGVEFDSVVGTICDDVSTAASLQDKKDLIEKYRFAVQLYLKKEIKYVDRWKIFRFRNFLRPNRWETLNPKDKKLMQSNSILSKLYEKFTKNCKHCDKL